MWAYPSPDRWEFARTTASSLLLKLCDENKTEFSSHFSQTTRRATLRCVGISPSPIMPNVPSESLSVWMRITHLQSFTRVRDTNQAIGDSECPVVTEL
jgi:hypothetical protein